MQKVENPSWIPQSSLGAPGIRVGAQGMRTGKEETLFRGSPRKDRGSFLAESPGSGQMNLRGSARVRVNPAVSMVPGAWGRNAPAGGGETTVLPGQRLAKAGGAGGGGGRVGRGWGSRAGRGRGGHVRRRGRGRESARERPESRGVAALGENCFQDGGVNVDRRFGRTQGTESQDQAEASAAGGQQSGTEDAKEK